MLAGVNDSPVDARRLARLLAGVKAKVNLIPLNAAAGIPFERPSDERGRRVRPDSGGARRHGLCQQEPRPRHPRGLRSADRRRTAAVARSAARDAGLQLAGTSGSASRPGATGSTSNSNSRRRHEYRAGYWRVGLHRQSLHLAASGRRSSRTHDREKPELARPTCARF